jgi:hypothetical protein
VRQRQHHGDGPGSSTRRCSACSSAVDARPAGHLVDIAAVAAAIKAIAGMIVLDTRTRSTSRDSGHPASTMFFYVNRATLLLQKINDSPDDSS